MVAHARRSGRHGDRALDAAERPDDRARARAARRHRHHLREPPQRHRRRRRALPEGRQCRDPARRLGELPLEPRAIHACLRRGAARGRPARAPRSSSCRPPTAPPSARCSPGSTARSTSSCRAAARAWSRACRTRRACRCSRISRASATSTSTRPPTLDMATSDRAQRQDAPHRRLRRDRDAAGRPRRRADAPRRRWSPTLIEAGCEFRGDDATRAADPRGQAGQRAGLVAPNISTPSSRSRWSTASTAPSPISSATARTTPRRSSPRTQAAARALPRRDRSRHRAAQRLDAVRRRRRIRLRRRDRHRHRPLPCARPGRASSSSPPSNTSCAAPGRPGRERRAHAMVSLPAAQAGRSATGRPASRASRMTLDRHHSLPYGRGLSARHPMAHLPPHAPGMRIGLFGGTLRPAA